jgi:exodeoxyribonuclease-3
MDLHNFYVPAGGDIPDVNINPKFADKLQFVEHMTQWLGARYQSSDKVILLGDLNIAPLENDVWSHKQLLQVVSHTPIEVKKYNELQKSLAFIDAHRYFVPESEKLYSWWSYRNRDWRKSNRGRRLDHILVTPALEQQIKAADIYISARDITKPSDHVPVSVDIG